MIGATEDPSFSSRRLQLVPAGAGRAVSAALVVSRGGHDWTRRFPVIVAAAGKLDFHCYSRRRGPRGEQQWPSRW